MSRPKGLTPMGRSTQSLHGESQPGHSLVSCENHATPTDLGDQTLDPTSGKPRVALDNLLG